MKYVPRCIVILLTRTVSYTFVIEFDTIILNGVSHCSPSRTTQVSRKRSIDDAIITTHNIDSLVDPPITEDTRQIMQLKKHRRSKSKLLFWKTLQQTEKCSPQEHSVYTFHGNKTVNGLLIVVSAL